MIKSLNSFVTFTVLCFLFSASAYAIDPTYKLVDLGLQESDASEAVAINDNGQVVGSYSMFGNKYYFCWTEQKGITLIDLPDTAVIRVLNNAGQIAGNYKDSFGKDHGFIWDNISGLNDIGTLGGAYTRVYDMNDLGQIVGESESSNISFVDGRPEQHAFLWQDGLMTDLGALSGDLGFLGDRSVATSINNHGQIIGMSNSLIAHKVKLLRKTNRAVAWLDGVIEEIGDTLDAQPNASATSVNNAGVATFGDEKNGYYAVNLQERRKIIFSINNFSTPFAVSDSNDIFVIHAGPSIYLGFFQGSDSKEYCFDNKFYDYVYLQNTFESPRQWKPNSFVGTCFNNNRMIVGVAQNIYGEKHGVLLKPIDE